MVLKKAKWFSVAGNGLRQSRQKYKSEMDKSRLKWNSQCGVLRHNPYVILWDNYLTREVRVKLPEPSRTVTYTTRDTVNRSARQELISNPVVLELSKEKEPFTWSSTNLARSDSCKKHKNFSRQAYSFLEVNLRRLRRNTWESKYDTREKNLSAVLANSSNHSRASQYIMQVNNTFTVNVIFCPSEANSWRLLKKNISCNRNEQKTIH